MKEIDEGPNDIENPRDLMQELGDFSLSSLRCIYRVPKRLRQGNDDEAYTPQVDLRMLENQLPLFILEDLFVADKYFDSTNKPSIISLSYAVFNTTFFTEGTKGVVLEEKWFSEVKHFVDLIRTSCLPSKTDERKVKYISTSSITELHRAGVKLKGGSTNNLFDVRFADGALEIPRLEISDHTEVLIRNLIAFEQCHYKEKYISDYVFLMDCFVNTPKDVELLVKNRIVENLLGDNGEVSTLINKLAKGVSINGYDFYFGTVAENLNSHCGTHWNKWKANLRQNYLNTPWAIISFVAAVFLLILTFIQTVCSIISIA